VDYSDAVGRTLVGLAVSSSLVPDLSHGGTKTRRRKNLRVSVANVRDTRYRLRATGTGYRPPAGGLRLLASGCWPPATGLRLLASGYWPPATSYQLPATGYRLLSVRRYDTAGSQNVSRVTSTARSAG